MSSKQIHGNFPLPGWADPRASGPRCGGNTAPMLSLGVLLELLQKLVMIPYPEKTCDR